jgi:hypothetical protein
MVLYNVDSQTAAHIHDGTLLTSGSVINTLPTGNFIDYTAILSAADYNKMRAGGTYINVHTAANPAGETPCCTGNRCCSGCSCACVAHCHGAAGGGARSRAQLLATRVGVHVR